ncbi:MAG: hypothetical protein ACOYNR_11360, partial [Blastocatellia bacterium]
MPHASSKALLAALLSLTILVSSTGARPSILRGASPLDQPRAGSAKRLPVGVERADWEGILAAHEDWNHTIRRAKGQGERWEGTNTQTGLRATFDARG